MPAISLQLIRLRIAWYAHTTAQLTNRHWQWLVLALLLVPAGIPIDALLHALAFPLTALFSAGHGFSWYFWYLLTTQALALVWVLPQRASIRGGMFMHYVDTLPIPSAARLASDLTLLLLANTVLIGLLANGIVISAFSQTGSAAFRVTLLLSLLMLTLGLQLSALDRCWNRLPLLATGDILFAFALSASSPIHAWPLLGAALITGLISLRLRGRSQSGKGKLDTNHTAGIRRWLPAFIGIQYDVLQARAGITSLRLVLTGLLTALTVRAGSFFDYDGRVLPLTILVLACIALVLSGFYRTLRTAHAPMQAYLAALPIGRLYWPLRDVLCVLLCGVAPLIPISLSLSFHFPLTAWIGLAVAYLLLLVVLRLPLVAAGRQAALAALLLAGVWSGVAMAAVVR